MLLLTFQFLYGCFIALSVFAFFCVLVLIAAVVVMTGIEEQRCRKAKRERAENARQARQVANEFMLSRLTPEDHAEIERIIHVTGCKL